MARAIALALILLLPSLSPAAEPAGKGSPAPRAPGKGGAAAPREKGGRPDGERKLEEVRITGTPEAPDILFFLPRARFRLLPPRPDRGWGERFLASTPDLEKEPR